MSKLGLVLVIGATLALAGCMPPPPAGPSQAGQKAGGHGGPLHPVSVAPGAFDRPH